MILEKLKSHLLTPGFKPGDRIPTEMALAKRFKVSRGKIREATTTLCQLGILESKPRRGTVVRSFAADHAVSDLQFRFEMSRFDPSEFQEAREVIEKAILPLAIKRMTPSLLAELEDSANAMKSKLHDPEAADVEDRRFHLTLLKACGNRTLSAFGEVISILFRKDLRKQYWTSEFLAAAQRDHAQIAAAIKAGDGERAMAILSAHFKKNDEGASK